MHQQANICKLSVWPYLALQHVKTSFPDINNSVTNPQKLMPSLKLSKQMWSKKKTKLEIWNLKSGNISSERGCYWKRAVKAISKR